MKKEITDIFKTSEISDSQNFSKIKIDNFIKFCQILTKFSQISKQTYLK